MSEIHQQIFFYGGTDTAKGRIYFYRKTGPKGFRLYCLERIGARRRFRFMRCNGSSPVSEIPFPFEQITPPPGQTPLLNAARTWVRIQRRKQQDAQFTLDL